MSRVKVVFRIVCITTIFHIHWDPTGVSKQITSGFVNWSMALGIMWILQVTRPLYLSVKTLPLLSLYNLGSVDVVMKILDMYALSDFVFCWRHITLQDPFYQLSATFRKLLAFHKKPAICFN